MNTIWGPWQKTEDGIVSRFRQWWTCDNPLIGHDATIEDERCKRCGARRSKTITVYPGIKGSNDAA